MLRRWDLVKFVSGLLFCMEINFLTANSCKGVNVAAIKQLHRLCLFSLHLSNEFEKIL